MLEFATFIELGNCMTTLNPIARPSLASLLIRIKYNDTELATGTAFTVLTSRGLFLITNRHNVTGRDQITGNPLDKTNAAIPNKIIISHVKEASAPEWVEKTELLYENGDLNGKQLWIEHPKLGTKADFVALPLTSLDDVIPVAYDLKDTGPNISLAPAEIVSVVGFPFGLTAGGSFAVWATGFIATEPTIDYNDLPIQLIDCRSRQGQSGSPVLAYRAGGAVTFEDKSQVIGGANNPVCRFVGIYSGRIRGDSDLGMVWKVSAIKELIDYCENM